MSENSIYNIFNPKNVKSDLFKQILTYYNCLPIIEDENVLLSVINSFAQTVWNNEENFKMEYIEYPILDSNQPISFWNNSLSEKIENFSLSMIEENYKNEKILMNAVAKGELHKVNSLHLPCLTTARKKE